MVNVNKWIDETDTKAILAGVLTLATVVATFMFQNVPDTLGTLTGLAVGYYFGKE